MCKMPVCKILLLHIKSKAIMIQKRRKGLQVLKRHTGRLRLSSLVGSLREISVLAVVLLHLLCNKKRVVLLHCQIGLHKKETSGQLKYTSSYLQIISLKYRIVPHLHQNYIPTYSLSSIYNWKLLPQNFLFAFNQIIKLNPVQ